MNCQEDLDIFNSNQEYYDIIICDLNTPTLNGMDFIKEIRKKDSAVKICVLTATCPSDLNDLIDEKNIDGIFEKPVKTEILVSYIESIL